MLAADIIQVLQDEEPINCTPRQIFGQLKREVVVGVAASAIHSVAFTSTSLYTWGKNEGQLGLIDSDSRSLEVADRTPEGRSITLHLSHSDGFCNQSGNNMPSSESRCICVH